MSVFTQVPSDAFEKLQLNAGVLLTDFDPTTVAIPSDARIIGATTGGVAFSATPSYTDFGEDIDNCPKGTMELMKLDVWEITMSGTFVSVDGEALKMLTGVGDKTTASGVDKIVPRAELMQADFTTVWWVGDYSEVNTGTNAGFIAIKLFNALNTGGFQIQSGDKAKGQFAFSFAGHFSINAQDTVPFEIYVKQGTTGN